MKNDPLPCLLPRRHFLTAAAGSAAALVAGCQWRRRDEVTVYAALDREFSEPILDQFAAATGIAVLPKYDTESTKTVGLANAILAEKARPRCDLFWNNEILNTLRIKRAGLLDTYRSPAADDFPPSMVADDGTWHGFAARVRVLIVNTEAVPEDERPRSIHDLVDNRWRDRVAVAKPLFGTTATHAACLFAAWGGDAAREYFQKLKANARVLSGNKQVARAVAQGEVAFGITDTDDALVELEAGLPVAIVLPDQGEGGLGALRIPNTLALVKGSPHGEAARRLVDFLLTPAVEAQLATGPSGQIPLGSRCEAASRALPPGEHRWMQIDFEAAADHWDEAAAFLRDEFARID